MNEPDIAPLARRLAEENNVDWRRLEGSGDGGRIVERDVLTFLAKVMAGEEDLDPTPEPVPEGMQAWPDADVAAYRPDAAAPPVDRSLTSTLDDDLFLFDEAPGSGAAPTERRDDAPPVFDEPAAAAMPAEPQADEDDGGLLLVDEPEVQGETVVPSADDVEGDDEVFAFDAPAAVPDAGPATAPDLPDLFEPEESPPAAVADDALFVDDDASLDGAEDDQGVFLDLSDRRAVAASPRPAGDAVARRRADDFAAEEASVDDGLGFVIGDAAEEADPVAEERAHALVDADVALVRHGQVWRRRLDDRAFRSAVSQISDALGAAPSTVSVALLARAVRRAWPDASSVDGWWWTADGAQLRPVATDGRIADAIAALETPEDGAGGPTAPVVVADLSSIALDEAVLHLDAPVLALGRATGDGAWLTLSGDDVAQGAVAALGRVAEALAAPVRLLV
ncbi:MAG: E3 binding domain-containing protein [Trueperaceae bacterium]